MSRTHHARQARKNPDRLEKFVSISTSKACRKNYLGALARHKENAARFDSNQQIDETLGEKDHEVSTMRRQKVLARQTEERAKRGAQERLEIEAFNKELDARYEIGREIDKVEDSIARLRQLRFVIRAAEGSRHVVIYRIVAEANVLLGFGWDGSRAIREIYYSTSETQSNAA